MLTKSVVETADKINGKKYKQVFSDNMGKKTTPKAGLSLLKGASVDELDNREQEGGRVD